MKTIFIAILFLSGAVQAEDFFNDKDSMVPAERFSSEIANKILLDNMNTLPTPYFDPQTDTCFVNNCPQIHCSPCINKRRDCRTINCEGVKVDTWRETCS